MMADDFVVVVVPFPPNFGLQNEDREDGLSKYHI
jgi:hypothetical protein